MNTENFTWYNKRSKAQQQLFLDSINTSMNLDADVKTFVEIGTYDGRTAKTVVNILNQLGCKADFYSVDINLDIWCDINKKSRGWKPKDKWIESMKSLKPGLCAAQFVEGKSLEVDDQFTSIDWLFIDGCHCYECCYGELETYGPKVSVGGMILIDDTTNWVKNPNQWYHDIKKPRRFGVDKAIKDSKFLKNQCKLIKNIPTGHGIQAWQRMK